MSHNEASLSLIRGGTLYWVQEQTHLIRPDQWNVSRRLTLFVGLAWLPLLVLATADNPSNVQAVLTDSRIYSLVFVAIPLLLIAQITMEHRFRSMAQHFLDADLVPSDQIPTFERTMEKAQRLRDAKFPEILIVILVYAQMAYVLESGFIQHAAWAVEGTSLTPAGYYSILVTEPLFLLLLALVLWKWIIWIVVLWDLSRLRLQLDSTDGDRCGGLGFLGDIPTAFVPAAFAVSAVIGSAWRTQVLAGRTTLPSLSGPACALGFIVLFVLFLPLGLFAPALSRERHEGNLRYGALRHLHSLQFRAKWISKGREHAHELLGAPEISSLADISTSFNNAQAMSVFPFQKGAAIGLLAALAIPLLPVVTTKIPLKQLLKTLFEALR
jgi:hypothetical protein